MKKIAFIGVGVMGKPMVYNLKNAGYELSVFSRTASKIKNLSLDGITVCNSISQCVKSADVVITMVGYPSDVKSVYFDENGILNNVKKSTYLIDMTTTSPRLAEEIYEAAKQKDCYALDAPVSGGDIGAKNATLSIMVGGDFNVFEECNDIFKALGTTIIYEGEAGTGQHTKMSNQIAIAGAIAGTCESIAYAIKSGLSLDKMFDSITKGAAGSWQLTNMGGKIVKEDFSPGFFIKHFIKDMTIASEEARSRGLNLQVLELVLNTYKQLVKLGYEELGTQTLIKFYGVM